MKKLIYTLAVVAATFGLGYYLSPASGSDLHPATTECLHNCHPTTTTDCLHDCHPASTETVTVPVTVVTPPVTLPADTVTTTKTVQAPAAPAVTETVIQTVTQPAQTVTNTNTQTVTNIQTVAGPMQTVAGPTVTVTRDHKITKTIIRTRIVKAKTPARRKHHKKPHFTG